MVARCALVLLLTGSVAYAQDAPPPPETPKPEKSDKASEIERRAAAERVCEAHDPGCDWLGTFSRLEDTSIRRALAARGIEPEPQPWGKVIGHVHVYNEDVFAEKNWLRFFNHFHYTTRESAIRNELTIGEGDVWDPDKVAESSRALRDPLYSSIIAILPVKSREPGKVDMLVVTRDVWSLRFNTQYTYQEGSLTNLSTSISENNFLGHRNLFAIGAVMDQGAIGIGPTFLDKNVLGKHLDLRLRIEDIFTRKALEPGDATGLQDGHRFHSEGSAGTITLQRSLWSLASEWGGGASVSFANGIARAYSGTGLAHYDDPETPETEAIPWRYRLKTWSVGANAVRRWGTAYKSQVSFGNSVSSQRPTLLEDFPGDAMQAAHFIRDVFPRSELSSSVFVEYTVFQPRYRTLRNVDTYDLAEDVRLGPTASISVSQALKVIGSDFNYTRPTASIGYTLPWCRDGYLNVSGSASVRIQGGETIDNTAGAHLRAVSPQYRYGRVIAEAGVDTRWHDTQNQYYTIGSENGLRGFRISEFRGGDRRTALEIEARSVPRPVWIWRAGLVAFYEAGGVANSLSTMQLHHDAGFGLHLLVPQTSREVFRFNLAFPLDSTPYTKAFTPHFLAGFQTYF